MPKDASFLSRLGFLGIVVFLLISAELTRYAISIRSIIKWDFDLLAFANDLTFSKIFAGMNKFFFSYSCLTNFLPVATGMRNPSKRNLKYIFAITFTFLFAIVMIIGLMSYL